MITRLYRHRSGFTLVELAIVMTIIGLLIGGVLKGQQLMQNARVTKTIGQINSYQTAMQTFRDSYGSFPGDMPLARTRIPGCDDAHNCLNGNGDGYVGVMAAGWSGLLTSQAGTASLPQVETTMFWKHLALTNLITGIVPSANPATPVWGETHPVSAFDGGFHQAHGTCDACIQPFTGLIIQMRQPMSGVYNRNGSQYVGVISPVVAAQIDQKMDDSSPHTGWVVSPDSNGLCDSSQISRRYNTSNDKYCNLTFKIF